MPKLSPLPVLCRCRCCRHHRCCLLPQCIIAHLENADVGRLLRIFQYVQRYEADWEVAWLQAEQKEAEERKNEPMMVDEDMLGACVCAARMLPTGYITAGFRTQRFQWRAPRL